METVKVRMTPRQVTNRGLLVTIQFFMNDYHLQPSQADIDAALKIEKSVKPSERDRYLEFMNNVPMSDRKTARELRDGCILSQLFNRFRS